MFKIGFDNEKYLQMQSDKIRERIGQFGWNSAVSSLMITTLPACCRGLRRIAM